MSSLDEVKHKLGSLGSKLKAEGSARFFKTGPGQYGEGDIFIGVTTPEVKKLAKSYVDLDLSDLDSLIKSKIHEERFMALTILVNKYKLGDALIKKKIFDFYLSHSKFINNWDLVDNSASYIVGNWLSDKDKAILITLANSKDLWERRIAIVSTYVFIKNGSSVETFKIAEILINDPHDLIQKAVGWMLREVGKRCSQADEESFLDKHYKTMPRTALRYAIERFPEDLRQAYLKGEL